MDVYGPTGRATGAQPWDEKSKTDENAQEGNKAAVLANGT